MSAKKKLTDFNDLHQAKGKGLEAVAVAIAHAAPPGVLSAGHVTEVADWPDPVIPGSISMPEIPAALLPGWVGGMAIATKPDATCQAGEILAHEIMKPLYDLYVMARGVSALVREQSDGECIILADMLAEQILELHNHIDAQHIGVAGGAA
jgi:hypothetical protein